MNSTIDTTINKNISDRKTYELMANAIAFIRQNHRQQPDLAANLEAISPQQFKTSSAGLQIWYGIHETMFGDCLIATTARGICNLYFLNGMDDQAAVLMLTEEWSKAEIIGDREITQPICDRLFSHLPNLNTNNQPPLTLYVKGTNFQIQVWRALLRVPFGGIVTYQGLGRTIGRPNAARAIGNAVGINPISFIIPCHRVIRESGELGGYRWGLERKTAILGWEASYPK